MNATMLLKPNLALSRRSLIQVLLATAITTAAVMFLTDPGQAREYTVGPIKIVDPWAHSPPGGAKVAGGFMTLVNTGKEPDRLIGGSSAISNHFEVHEMVDDKGVMRMRNLEKGLEIPAGGKVELKPGGYHVMFIDLKSPMKAGDRIKGKLRFEKAGEIEIEYRIEARGAGGPGMHGGSHNGGGKAPHKGSH